MNFAHTTSHALHHGLYSAADAMQEPWQNPPPLPRDYAPAQPPHAAAMGFFPRIWRGAVSAFDCLFGLAALIFGLALLAVVPVMNFLSLGYLLHASGRIATTGRLRDGFVGLRKASQLGSVAAGIWLIFWPLRFLAELWRDAALIAPQAPSTQTLRVALIGLTLLTLAHIAWAVLRGGRLRHFLWPAPLALLRWLKTPNKYRKTNQAFSAFLAGLRLPYYFWLGLRGFAGSLLWLILPVALLMLSTTLGKAGALLALPGICLLVIVSMHLPFLQTHFATTGRFRALFELKQVRKLFCQAPLAYCVALLASLLFALPLYLLKIELTPAELAFLPSLVFVVFMLPARLLTGWAMSRSLRRTGRRHALIVWLARATILPVALLYAVFVYFMPYLTWNGASSLLEQHAFLVPTPALVE
jgi:hypothetical protein